MKWLTLEKAGQIPEEWNHAIGTNIFLSKKFLQHLEAVNPCRQSYNLLYSAGAVKAVYVDYRLKLDIFTYSFLSLSIPVLIMGVPCSVSKQGFAVEKGFEPLLAQHFQRKPGAKLILNTSLSIPLARGETLPTFRLELRWRTLDEYLQSLRSSYRYRLIKALKKWADVKVELVNPAEFEPQMYEQYAAVYQNSTAKLERQKAEFFSGNPLSAPIIKASYQGNLLGFIQLVENGEELIFLFTGFNYQLNKRFDIYLNLLLEIVRYATRHNFKVIDFGQTAEETKMKLGSKMVRKAMYFSHSNPLINLAAGKMAGLLSYRPPDHHFQVFKTNRHSKY